MFKISIFASNMKEGKTKRIDELVEQVLRNMGLEQRYKEYEVTQIWPEVVGQMIASRTKKIKVIDGILFVSFDSAVVRNEISMVKEGLVRALNERVGKNVIKDIVIR